MTAFWFEDSVTVCSNLRTRMVSVTSPGFDLTVVMSQEEFSSYLATASTEVYLKEIAQ